jgi:putative glutamine amidotransferase
MTRPLIGVTTDVGAAVWRDRIREAILSPAVYSSALERAGAVPVLLPPVLAGAAGQLAAGLDGLVFCGAAADFECALIREAVRTGVPFLALSHGLPLLNLCLGGTLVPAPAVPGDPPDSCSVRISPDSRLGRMLGPSATVTAGRRQVLGELGSGLTAVAWDGDETVAAVEVTGHQFGLGIRWHPGENDDPRIFAELRTAAAARQAPVPVAAS